MFIKKIIKFFKYPFSKKRNLIIAILYNYTRHVFLFKNLYFKRYYLSHLPDSVVNGNLTCFQDLYLRYIYKNKLNNSGDISRLISFILNIDYILSDQCIKGDLAEVGVYKGNTAQILAFFAHKYRRNLYLFDTFKGFDANDLKGIDYKEKEGHFSDTSLSLVKETIDPNTLENCHFFEGYFPQSMPENFHNKKFSIVSIDVDLYVSTKACLEKFFPMMSDNGLFLLHDYSSGCWEGCRPAIDEFCIKNNQQLILIPDKSGSAFIRIRKNN